MKDTEDADEAVDRLQAVFQNRNYVAVNRNACYSNFFEK